MSPIEHHVTGSEYWRSLEQLADSPEVRAMMEQEFPGYDPEGIRSLSRRRFMKLMGASMALAGLTLTGCRRWPKEKIAPYSSSPRDRIPGVSEQYATVMEVNGIGQGLLVSSFDGRPIKVEGNPTHPMARFTEQLGAADAYAQASVLELYDPDRSRGPIDRTGREPRAASWDAFQKAASEQLAALRANGGLGLAVLTEAISGPSFAAMRQRLLKAFPQARWYEYEPLSRDNERTGTRLATGRSLRPLLHLDKASVIVSIDDDVLGTHPAHIRYAADWAAGRRSADQGRMNRVYIAESTYSNTGTVADERLPVRASRMAAIVSALAAKVGVPNATMPEGLAPDEQRFVETAAADLAHAGASGVVAAGAHLAPEVHAAVLAINAKLGAIGSTLSLLEAVDGDRPSHVEAITALAGEMRGGRVQMMVILGGNPLYDAPVDLEFGKALAAVPMSIHLSLYDNETSAGCKWHLPRAHYLEAWGDARAWDGLVSVAQPLIEPLYGGRSSLELLAMLAGEAVTDGEQIVRGTMAEMKLLAGGDQERAWRRVLHDGLVANSGFPVAQASVRTVAMPVSGAASGGIELRFLPDPSTLDGRFANSGWLQELPRPLTKLTWDNAALISKADADALGVQNGDVVRILLEGRSLEIAAFILPGQPAGVVALSLGYGRSALSLSVGRGVGFNTYALRGSQGMHVAGGARLEKAGRQYKLATTQDHHFIDRVGFKGREERAGEKGQSGKIIREASLEEYKADKHFAHRNEHGGVSLQLFQPPHTFAEPHAWGMAVDMGSCVGCNACVVACQAENNIPVVGKDQVAMSREMHWLRIDRYFKGAADDPNPQVAHQPMLCQHCENAPCEQVCPVAATVHDTEGLNTMVYNRCIGTRYCSNNCPYKVRRFNYFDFHSKDPRGSAKPWPWMPDSQQVNAVDKIKQMVFNPDVTVRMRGVMEKCTYCTQRIQAAKIERRNAGEELKDGDVVTACQQACPTQAIVFGDLNDPNSKVRKLQENNRAYGVLAELNTRPRTQYLAIVRNPATKA